MYKAVTVYAFDPAKDGPPYIEAAGVMTWRGDGYESDLPRAARVDSLNVSRKAQLLTREEILEVEGGADALAAWEANDHSVLAVREEEIQAKSDAEDIDILVQKWGDAEAKRIADAGYPADVMYQFLAKRLPSDAEVAAARS